MTEVSFQAAVSASAPKSSEAAFAERGHATPCSLTILWMGEERARLELEQEMHITARVGLLLAEERRNC